MAEKVWIREGIVAEGPEGETLAGNRCRACEQVFFPKVEQVCLNCMEKQLEDVPLSRKGKLCSHTVVHMPASGFQPPYAVGFVDLPEGIRVFTPLVMDKDKSFREGMEMEVRVGKLWEEEDKVVMGFRFAPVEG